MRFTLATILAIAATAAAAPSASTNNTKLSTSQAFRTQTDGTQCSVGDISCCNAADETTNSGLLSGLLGDGLLNNLAGSEGSACAKSSLIDELGLLALIEHTETGPVCKNIVACCPEGTESCVAIDTAGGDGSGEA
ncbi:hypothetical protein BDW62DRAFT_219198 [Aspergillus aurantiobrunneus]